MQSDLEDIFEDVLGGLAEVTEAVTTAADATQAVVDALDSLAGTADRILNVLEESLQSLNALALEHETRATGNARAIPVGPAGGAGESGLAGLAKAGAVAAASLGVLTLAVNVAQQKFRQIEEYVRLFNPGVVAQFHHALGNVGATIGQAFAPAIQVATEVTRRWAAILAPVMQQLAPVVRQVAETFGNVLVRVLTIFGNLLRAALPAVAQVAMVFGMVAEVLTPVLQGISQVLRVLLLLARVGFELSGFGLVVRVVTKLFEALSTVLTVVDEALSIVEVVVGTLVDAFLEMVAGFIPVKDVMNRLNDAVQWVIRNMYVFAVHLARMAGLTNVVDALIAHVEGKLQTGATAAQQPQIKTLDQLGKDLALAAAAAGGAAGGGNGIRDQREFWQKTLEEMRAAKANGMSIKDLIAAILDELKKLNPFGPGPAAAPSPGGGQVGAGGLPSGAVPGMVAGGLLGGPVGLVLGGVTGARLGSR